MHIFLTSSPTGPLDGSYKVDGFDYRNGFLASLREVWRPDARVLIITADPDNHDGNMKMTEYFMDAARVSGLSYSDFDLWDAFTTSRMRPTLLGYDVVILGGGHVPTQKAFFDYLNLKELLKEFDGTLIGISAGSMNCAELVYAQPELEGEAADPNYVRFFPGLGLTDINILPHYQMVKDNWLDGMQLFRDITIPDGEGHNFLILSDGSYLYIRPDGSQTVYGDAWAVIDGQMPQICTYAKSVELHRL